MSSTSATAEATKLHNWHHDNYDEAKLQILQAIGSTDDLEIFGKTVLVAPYIRPEKTATGLFMTKKQQSEDIYQGKAVLIVKCGPDAFNGDASWLAANFGDRKPPEPGDWCFLRADSGFDVSLCGDGAQRVKGKDSVGRAIDVYDWDGWPCRIVSDEHFIGRLNKPHQLV